MADLLSSKPDDACINGCPDGSGRFPPRMILPAGLQHLFKFPSGKTSVIFGDSGSIVFFYFGYQLVYADGGGHRVRIFL